jgi:hypothetical protein
MTSDEITARGEIIRSMLYGSRERNALTACYSEYFHGIKMQARAEELESAKKENQPRQV